MAGLEYHVSDLLEEVIFVPLSFLSKLVIDTAIAQDPEELLDVENENCFENEFALGPGGLHAVVNILAEIHTFLLKATSLPNEAQLEICT